MRALVRDIPATFAQALCAQAPPSPIDVELARLQHAAYVDALAAAGASVQRLPADDAHADCCFVEDRAVIVDDVALITQPGAPSRRGETAAVAAALAPHVEIARMTGNATLDGGDVMRVGDTIYVGQSGRTNAAGIARLTEVFSRMRIVTVWLPANVLHLKCVVSPLGEDTVLLADESIAPTAFDANVVRVPVAETYAANAVAVGRHVVVAGGRAPAHAGRGGGGEVYRPPRGGGPGSERRLVG